jgi:hypothetical protein
VRKVGKVLLWAVILLACAGVGAVVASRSNPFPPEVAPESPTPTPEEEVTTTWRLTMSSRTTHTFLVGGSCRSDWRMRARIRVTPEGVVRGVGPARLQPGARCDFETAQIQTRVVGVRITGERIGERLRLRFQVADVAPAGSRDLGSFVATLSEMRFSVPERDGGSTSGPTKVRIDDDRHVSRTRLELST